MIYIIITGYGHTADSLSSLFCTAVDVIDIFVMDVDVCKWSLDCVFCWRWLFEKAPYLVYIGASIDWGCYVSMTFVVVCCLVYWSSVSIGSPDTVTWSIDVCFWNQNGGLCTVSDWFSSKFELMYMYYI